MRTLLATFKRSNNGLGGESPLARCAQVSDAHLDASSALLDALAGVSGRVKRQVEMMTHSNVANLEMMTEWQVTRESVVFVTSQRPHQMTRSKRRVETTMSERQMMSGNDKKSNIMRNGDEEQTTKSDESL